MLSGYALIMHDTDRNVSGFHAIGCFFWLRQGITMTFTESAPSLSLPIISDLSLISQSKVQVDSSLLCVFLDPCHLLGECGLISVVLKDGQMGSICLNVLYYLICLGRALQMVEAWTDTMCSALAPEV
jgi:hypothetical protein